MSTEKKNTNFSYQASSDEVSPTLTTKGKDDISSSGSRKKRATIGKPITDNRAKRPSRVPLKDQQLLTVPKRAGYHTRLVNDKGDRIARFMRAGYELRKNADELVGDAVSAQPTRFGNVVSRVVNPSQGTRAYVMDIPLELYQEDQEAKIREIDKKEESIREPSANQYLVQDNQDVDIGKE